MVRKRTHRVLSPNQSISGDFQTKFETVIFRISNDEIRPWRAQHACFPKSFRKLQNIRALYEDHVQIMTRLGDFIDRSDAVSFVVAAELLVVWFRSNPLKIAACGHKWLCYSDIST